MTGSRPAVVLVLMVASGVAAGGLAFWILSGGPRPGTSDVDGTNLDDGGGEFRHIMPTGCEREHVVGALAAQRLLRLLNSGEADQAMLCAIDALLLQSLRSCRPIDDPSATGPRTPVIPPSQDDLQAELFPPFNRLPRWDEARAETDRPFGLRPVDPSDSFLPNLSSKQDQEVRLALLLVALAKEWARRDQPQRAWALFDAAAELASGIADAPPSLREFILAEWRAFDRSRIRQDRMLRREAPGIEPVKLLCGPRPDAT